MVSPESFFWKTFWTLYLRQIRLLLSNYLQFCFKKHSSCSHAIFVLRQVAEFCVTHGSNVYMAALDAKRLLIACIILFYVLSDRKIPFFIIKVIVNWYSKMFASVRWNGAFSNMLPIKRGVLRSSHLSPSFFNLYVDVIIDALSKAGYCCFVRKIYMGCIVYADDIILLFASIVALQEMLNICFHKGEELDIIINNSKSFLFKIGPSYDCCIQILKLGAADIVWTPEIKYLGVNFCCGKNWCVDLSGRMRKYYAAVNSIISHTKNVNDILKLNLLERYALLILKYSCESLLLNDNTLDILNVCWNNVFRKVFKMNRWESVKMVSILLCRMDFIHIHHLEKLKFIAKVLNCDNIAVSTCYKLFSHSNELKTFSWFYDVSQDYSIILLKGRFTSILKHFVICVINLLV